MHTASHFPLDKMGFQYANLRQHNAIYVYFMDADAAP